MTNLFAALPAMTPAGTFVLPGDIVTAFVETLPWPALMVDECGFIACVNAALRTHRGLGPSPAAARLDDAFPEYRAAIRGDPWWSLPQEAEIAREADGRLLHERLVVRPMRGGACLIVEDATRLRELEAADVQTARLASIGFMLAGACHEISNPLAAIYSMVQLLSSNPQAAAPDVQRGLAHIGQNVHRLLDVCQRLCGYSRAAQEPARHFALDAAVDESIALLRQSGQVDAVEIARETDARAVVSGHAGELRQVFDNILANAVQAMDGCGRLLVRTSVDDAGHAVVAFHDSGPGIAPAALARLFEPFFTTKRNGKGTGLGLAISRDLVQQHGGEIRARNDATRGAWFIVELPLHQTR